VLDKTLTFLSCILAKQSIAFGYFGLKSVQYTGQTPDTLARESRPASIVQGFFNLWLHGLGLGSSFTMTLAVLCTQQC